MKNGIITLGTETQTTELFLIFLKDKSKFKCYAEFYDSEFSFYVKESKCPVLTLNRDFVMAVTKMSKPTTMHVVKNA